MTAQTRFTALLVLAFLTLAFAYFFQTYDLVLALFFGVVALSGLILLRNAYKTAYEITVFSLPLSVPATLLPNTQMLLPAEFCLTVLALSLLVLFIKNRLFKLWLRHPWPALWALSLFAATLFSEMPLVSAKFAIINAIYVWVFYYGLNLYLQEGGAFLKPIRLFAWGILPACLWGFWQFARFEFNPITLRGLFEPFFYSHTYFGATTAVLGGYFTGKAFENRKWVWWAVFFILLTIGSQSRAALWSLLFMGGVAVYMGLKPWLKWALPVFVLLTMASLSSPENWLYIFEQNAFESHNPQASLAEKTMSVTNLTTDVSNVERLNRWISALRMFKEKPHHGFGPGTYQFTYIPFQEPALENRLTVKNPDSPPEGSGGTAHSEWLLQLSECGWPTFSLFVSLLALWFFKAFKKGENQKALLPFILGLLTYYFHMHFNNFLNQAAFAFLFWSFGAMIQFSSNTNPACTITKK